MPKTEFDQLASRYKEVHKTVLAITGEEDEYFAQYKMRDFAGIVANLGIAGDGSYLDFGSGIGNSIKPFHEALPKAKLICADVSADSLSESRNIHGADCEYLLIADSKLKLEASSIDGAFACCVFHHIPPAEHSSALAELRRVLKPNSPLMIYEHNPRNPLTVRAVNNCALDKNAILIAASEMRRRCVEAGFRSVAIRYRVYFPSALRSLRPLERGLKWVPLGAQYYVCAQA